MASWLWDICKKIIFHTKCSLLGGEGDGIYIWYQQKYSKSDKFKTFVCEISKSKAAESTRVLTKHQTQKKNNWVMLRCVLQTLPCWKWLCFYIDSFSKMSWSKLVGTPDIAGGKPINLSSFHHLAPFITPFQPAKQPSQHPRTAHPGGVWLENSSFSPKKIGEVIPEASGWKVQMSLWRLWRKWPISSQNQWNLFILECHLIDPCDPWECFVPLTTCDLSKKNWVEVLQTFWKEGKFDFDYVLNFLCWLYITPIKLGGCVESSTFCPFL